MSGSIAAPWNAKGNEAASAVEARLSVAVHAVDDRHAKVAADKLSAAAGYSGRYRLVPAEEDPALVLLVAAPDGDPTMLGVQRDPVYRRLRSKSVVINEADNPITLLPGLYAGTDRLRIDGSWVASGPYLQKLRRSELEGDGVDQPIEHLYSFVGSTYTHPVREQLLSLNDDRGFIRDSGDKATVDRVQQPDSHEVLRERQRGYDLTLARSAFVLCPRGRSPASIRFFETLRAGRVPVIISDDWELPAGPDWDAFVLRVPESQIAEIPSLLRQQEGKAAELGRLARQAWEDWFADGVIFDRVVGWAISLQKARRDSFFSRLWRQRILLSKQHRRDALRLFLNRWRGR